MSNDVDNRTRILQLAHTITRDDEDDAAPIIQIANAIIQQAIREGAAKICVEPGRDTVQVLFALEGEPVQAMALPGAIHRPLVERYKVMADLDIAEQSVPQDGHLVISHTIAHSGSDYDLHVHAQPSPLGERIIMALHARP